MFNNIKFIYIQHIRIHTQNVQKICTLGYKEVENTHTK